MNGNTLDWSYIDVSVPAGDVVVCRRVAGSGTQAAINDFFFGFPCSSTQQIPAAAGITGNPVIPGGKYIVIENNSSGDLAACMTAVQLGLDPGYTINLANGAIALTAVDATHIALPAGGRAIGLMGLDRAATNTKTAGITGTAGGTVSVLETYKPVSIDGVFPSVESASTGAYDIVVNNSFNTRNYSLPGLPLLSSDVNKFAFYNAVKNTSGDKTLLGASKTPSLPGLLAIADPVLGNYDPTLVAPGLPFAGTLLNPVMRVHKVNSCQPAAQVQ